MKTIIFLIIMFFMSSTLGASTNYANNQLGYTTYKADTFSSGLFSLKANSYSDLEFKLGMTEGFKRLDGSYKEDSNLLNRVVVWMSYKF